MPFNPYCSFSAGLQCVNDCLSHWFSSMDDGDDDDWKKQTKKKKEEK